MLGKPRRKGFKGRYMPPPKQGECALEREALGSVALGWSVAYGRREEKKCLEVSERRRSSASGRASVGNQGGEQPVGSF